MGYLISSWFDIIVLLAATLVLLRLTIAVTDRTSRAEYRPVMTTMMKEAFTTNAFLLLHDGRYRQEITDGVFVAPDVAKGRLIGARESLDQIAKLFDTAREAGESDDDLLERLVRFFPGVSLERPSV